MQFLSSPTHLLTSFPFLPFFSNTLSPYSSLKSHKLGFQFPKLNTTSTFQVHRNPIQKQLSDQDDEEEEFDEDEDIAADEYSEFLVEASDAEDEEEDDDDVDESASNNEATVTTPSRYEEHKWQRVERLRNEVKEFGEGIIDIEELISIYDFRIDKFQVIIVI
ncbi:hypothetical protein ACHQM5_022702 [Ranunculus cassubicifolius]